MSRSRCSVSVHDVVVLTSAGCVRLLISGLWFTPGILYVAFLNEFQRSSGMTSWITTIQYFSSCIMCVVGGLLVKRVDSRLVTVSGGIMLSAGLLTSMWASHISHIFLTYGVLSGLGSGLAYIGSVQSLNLQITKYRNVLFGMCAFVGNLGVMLYPPLLQTLIDRYTWRGMFLVLAAFELNVAAVALVKVSRRRVTIEYSVGEGDHDGEKGATSSDDGAEKTLLTNLIDIGHYKEEDEHSVDTEKCVKAEVNAIEGDQSAGVTEVVASSEHTDKNRTVIGQHSGDPGKVIGEDVRNEVVEENDTDEDDVAASTRDRVGETLMNEDSDNKSNIGMTLLNRKNLCNAEKTNGGAMLLSQNGVRERLLNNEDGEQLGEEQMTEKNHANLQKPKAEIANGTNVKSNGFLDENSFLKDPHYHLYLLSGALFLFGTSIVLGHLSAYIVSNKLSDKLGASMVYMVNALTMAVAKLLQGFILGDKRLQPSTLHVILTGTGGITSFIFLFELSLPVVYAYVVVFGVCNSAVGGALMPAMATKLAGGQSFAFALGLVACATAVGSLLGAPVAGWILDSTHSYKIPFLVSAIAMTSGCAVMLASIWMKRISSSRANSRMIS